MNCLESLHQVRNHHWCPHFSHTACPEISSVSFSNAESIVWEYPFDTARTLWTQSMTFTSVNESKEAEDRERLVVSCNAGCDVYVPNKNHLCPRISKEKEKSEAFHGDDITDSSFLQYSNHFECILGTDLVKDLQIVYCHPAYSIFLTYTRPPWECFLVRYSVLSHNY